ncbi:hypothetical protein D9757_001517 [Collybiopsis confluens]|uniref:Uracil-DNA glycosylase n=1 Tax=Collybiopsis confluens TaxID=2823264 RepID=A0A8H5HZ31_9AGAR|nr:hypothetical protein D9757_001517 [Collybiopsis confluens]
MSDEEQVEYYEDLAPSSSPATSLTLAPPSSPSPVASSPPASSPAGSVSKPTKTAVKRQMAITDLFQNSTPNSKRLKTSASLTSVSSSPTKLNSIPFSMKTFQDSLNEEQAKYLRLECEAMGKSWLKLLQEEIKKPYFIALKRFLWTAGVQGPHDSPLPLKVYPSPRDIYTWSQLTPLGKVKVVVIGQDPYPGPNQAHGLCFSVRMGIPVPPSLINIYAEIKQEYPKFEPPKHGHLAAWASAGVLMLNSCLTVQARQANSHSDKGWEKFTDKVIECVDKYGGASIKSGSSAEASGIGRGVVILAWGAFAEKRVAKLDKIPTMSHPTAPDLISATRCFNARFECSLLRTRQTKHLILKSAHPSPRSAHKGFLGNGHFRAANDWLRIKYGPEGPVDWCRLDVDGPLEPTVLD